MGLVRNAGVTTQTKKRGGEDNNSMNLPVPPRRGVLGCHISADRVK